MMFARGLFWLALAAGIGPELITPTHAEPRSAVAAEGPAVLVAAATAPPASIAAAKPVAPPKPAVTLMAKIDLARQTLTVTEHGKPIGTWKISSGVSEDLATPRGLFQPEWTAKMWYSKKYDDAPMPHAVFFKGGAAIHATQALGRLGSPASHGCVRLAPANAEVFYRLVQRHGLAHTRVHVFGSPNYPHTQVAHASQHRAPSRGRIGNGGIFQTSDASDSWSQPRRTASYSSAGSFSGPAYARLPISAIRVR